MQILDQENWNRPGVDASERAREVVLDLLNGIRERGDEAISEASLRYDGFEPLVIPLKAPETYGLSDELLRAMIAASNRIRQFAERQMAAYADLEFWDETGRFGHRVIPVERVAAYVPGGRFPLISSAMMTVIPARVAGVEDVLAVSPSDHPALLAAASLSGATSFLRLGGAQAIAACALGSAWCPKVDMVVGPGNAFVNAAKALLQNVVRIDTLAGPSEILILADRSMPVPWIVEDMLAQAEHDPMALSVLASTQRDLLEAVAKQLDSVRQSGQGVFQGVWCGDDEALVRFSKRMAPEHLLVATENARELEPRLVHFGSLFVGPFSAVALGDYCSGPNHTLPTSGSARMKAGLHVGDFLKVATVQEVTPSGFEPLAGIAAVLARAEGLTHHRQSLDIRRGAVAEG